MPAAHLGRLSNPDGHSGGMALNQPALSKAQWHTEVGKMRAAYKAPIDPKDVDAIVDYLVRLGGH